EPLPPADDLGLEDLLGLGAAPSPTAAPPAAPAARRTSEESALEELEKLRPAARTATKFQAAAPKKTAPEGGGLDLGALAEAAFAAASPPAPAPTPSPAPEPPRVEAAAAAAPPAEEAEYGPYRLLERIAVGGMAEVYRAKRTGVEGFEKVVAVKRILGHLSDNKEFVDMFIDEAKVVAGLTHPNIVQMFDLGKIDRSYYIAMEYVHGRDLRTILRRARERGMKMPLDLAAFVASQVAAALEYAHRKKDERGRPMMIVHRDVSAQNILISFEGDVKLADFGIAKAATKATITDRGALRGKLLYMSPEQAWGKPMDRRSDIFSLGICLYEMLTDQKPFLGSSEMSILETVRECRVSPPTTLNPRIPETLEKVVMKALEKDPEVRYQDAGEMHRDLDRVLRERQPPTARDLAKLMEVLFDEKERGTEHHGEWSGEHQAAVHPGLEVDMGAPDPPAEKKPADAMNIQKLLKRFGLK
ncbi:MAG TPA: protein kinase, partial [Vicinamibacteria bacterium]|nr:protein kinase [Vicinamibacteria bacterium]